jgi:Folate-dependent phosphoribosylglycinamide formyltransferase PurN
MKKQLAVFASGTGTNFEAIARACADGVLDAEVAVMVCDKPGAAVIEKAARYGIDTFVFSPKAYADKAAFEAEIVKVLDAKNIDLVCLAGYMRIVGETLLKAYEGRIINIHPSLLPSFKGAHAVETPSPTASRSMASPSIGSMPTWTAERSSPSGPSTTTGTTPPRCTASARKSNTHCILKQ